MERIITKTLMEQFECSLIEDEKSKATLDKYHRDINSFYCFTQDEEITKETVIRYKQYLQTRYAPSSVNSMLAAINRFFKEVGWYECIVKSVRVQRQNFRDDNKELTKEEYYMLLETARKKGRYRLYYMLQAICATGIRVSELQFITVEAVHQGRAVVTLKGKTRTVLIPSALCEELSFYAKKRGVTSGSVFVTRNGEPLDRSNILHEMKALCDAAGVDREKVFPHNLRHLFACSYYHEVKDLSRLADLLGHSSVNTTRIYTSVSGMEQAKQIEKLGLVVQ